MKKLGIPLLLFFILGGATAWYLSDSGNKSSTYDISDRQFAVEAEDVHRIFLADRRGETVILERDGEDQWIYNKEYRARPDAMRNLLDAIERIELKYIPSQAAAENAVSAFVSHGIKVELYNKQKEKLKVYYVGGMTNDELGTYMMMEGSDNPYVMHIPTWQGGLRAKYFMYGDDWRDKTIFANEVEEIQTVSVEYPNKKNKSFKIERAGNDFEVSPIFANTTKKSNEVIQGKVEAYLINYKSVIAEAYQNRHPDRDSISSLIPFCKINLKTNKGKETNVVFHPIFTLDGDGQPFADSEVVTGTPVERYHTIVNDQDFMLVQQRVFGELFWAYDSFFE